MLPNALAQTINNSLRVLTFTCVIKSLQMYKSWGNKHFKLIFQTFSKPIPPNCLTTKTHKGLLILARDQKQGRRGTYRLENIRISKQFFDIKRQNRSIFNNIKQIHIIKYYLGERTLEGR